MKARRDDFTSIAAKPLILLTIVQVNCSTLFYAPYVKFMLTLTANTKNVFDGMLGLLFKFSFADVADSATTRGTESVPFWKIIQNEATLMK